MNQLDRVTEVNEVTGNDYITVYIEVGGVLVLRKIKTSNAFNGQTLIPNIVFVSEKSDFPTRRSSDLVNLQGTTDVIQLLEANYNDDERKAIVSFKKFTGASNTKITTVF